LRVEGRGDSKQLKNTGLLVALHGKRDWEHHTLKKAAQLKKRKRENGKEGKKKGPRLV